MRQATRYGDRERQQLGLHEQAGPDDLAKAVEVTGEQTDIHKVTASKMFGVHYSMVTDEMRRAGKQAYLRGLF